MTPEQKVLRYFIIIIFICIGLFALTEINLVKLPEPVEEAVTVDEMKNPYTEAAKKAADKVDIEDANSDDVIFLMEENETDVVVIFPSEDEVLESWEPGTYKCERWVKE